MAAGVIPGLDLEAEHVVIFALGAGWAIDRGIQILKEWRHSARDSNGQKLYTKELYDRLLLIEGRMRGDEQHDRINPKDVFERVIALDSRIAAIQEQVQVYIRNDVDLHTRILTKIEALGKSG